MGNRFLSLRLNLKVRADKADKIIKNAALDSIHSRQAIGVFENSGAISCMQHILKTDYLILTDCVGHCIHANAEIWPICDEPWPGKEFIEFLKSISPAIEAGSRAEFLMFGHTVMSIHFIGSSLSVWTPREPVTHWDSTFI